jgi:hypothetical protein
MQPVDREAETSGAKIRCLSCSRSFPASSLRWIAESPGIPQDPVLGGGESLRFLPTRFDVSGRAVDPNGAACARVACPHCRAELPREIVVRASSGGISA